MTGLSELVNTLSSGYMVSQALVIILLYVTGSLFVTAAWRGRDPGGILGVLLAFPSGLALFAMSAFLMLCTGIPFNIYTSIGAMGIISLISVIKGLREGIYVDIIRDRFRLGTIVIALCSAIVLTFMLTANLFDVVLDNDSFYYFSTYPEAIVKEGRYIRYFDVFLTDAAPVGSIIQTLPYIFGFSETFGIQYFLDADFMLIFAYALYSELSGRLGQKKAACCSAAGSVFLLTSSAYLVTAKWVMAGVYFMSFFFITAWFCFRMSFAARKPLILMALLATSLAMMRQEGVVMTAILIITLSVLSGYSGRELAFSMALPVTICAALYYFRVFAVLGVHPLYAFLTPLKALVMICMLVVCLIYLIFIRDRLSEEVRNKLIILLPAVLFIVNMGVVLLRSSEYLGNLKMFYLNVRIGAGWGYFGYMAGILVFLLFIKAVLNKEWYLLFFDSLMVSYVLGVLIVSFGRGDALRKGVGDSGNRVMLTAVPIIVFAIVIRYFTDKPGQGIACGRVLDDTAANNLAKEDVKEDGEG